MSTQLINTQVNESKMGKVMGFVMVLCNCCLMAYGREYILESPNKSIRATIGVEEEIQYSLAFKGNNYILPSSISMTLGNGNVLGRNPEVRKTNRRSINKALHPVYGISSQISERYNELRIDFKGSYSVIFRAYNEGFAWRFATGFPGEITVQSEQTDFYFAGNYESYFHPVISEGFYRKQLVSDHQNKPNYTSLPVLVKTPENYNILIHEADVLKYPCLTLSADSTRQGLLVGKHSSYPKTVKPGGYKNFTLIVVEPEKFISKTTGKRDFPWRIVAFEETDKGILANQLVHLLASENKLEDTSWVKCGKVAWDWWNALNLSGVSFRSGFNTETYKYFIDFAADNGIEYVNLDEGWSDQFDLLKTTDKLDMEELTQYAKSRGVGLFLWCVWRTLDSQMTEALNLFEKLGIAGLKVDFMDRDDQVIVEFQERLLVEAAKKKMLVNYHGAYHPTGMSRTYPNHINVEGVRGLEWNKFNAQGTTPDHAVTIPFIRMFAGPMDYTPGAMSNFNQQDWKQIFDRPMSQGTRCHQLAMYVIYFAPLQMLSDSPTAYLKEPGFLKFLTGIPTEWDETTPLQSKLGEYVTMARRKDNLWYVGAMSNWNPRELVIHLDFLDDDKNYIAEIYADGINADKVGNDYSVLTKEAIKKGDSFTIKMAPGGGYVAKIIEK